MKILSLECSAGPASAAVIQDGVIIASAFLNRKITHSQTLLTMVEDVLHRSALTVDELDGIAVSSGPGSFTGIRIGISAVKGLAAAHRIACVGVSTLRGMAENLRGENGLVCAVMDARCNQVYNALFSSQNGELTRLCEDRALSFDELIFSLKEQNPDTPVILVGDGAELFYNYAAEQLPLRLANEQLRFQNACGVGLAALEDFKNNNTQSALELLPCYLRLPQAERELKKKRGEEQ